MIIILVIYMVCNLLHSPSIARDHLHGLYVTSCTVYTSCAVYITHSRVLYLMTH